MGILIIPLILTMSMLASVGAGAVLGQQKILKEKRYVIRYERLRNIQ